MWEACAVTRHMLVVGMEVKLGSLEGFIFTADSVRLGGNREECACYYSYCRVSVEHPHGYGCGDQRRDLSYCLYISETAGKGKE